MNNEDRRAVLRIGYKELLVAMPAMIDEGAQSANEKLREVAQDILARQQTGLREIRAMPAPEDIPDRFIDELICRYSGLQGCLLDDQFILDTDPQVAQVMAEYLDTVDENLREFADQDFTIWRSETFKPAFYEAVFGSRADAVVGARLNLVGAMICDVQALMKQGLFPTPAPQYPSGSVSLSSSWAMPPPETQ